MRKNSFVSSIVLLSSLSFVVVGGCGSDEESPSNGSGGRAGSGGSATAGTSNGGSTATAGTSSGGTSSGGTMGSPEPTGSTCEMASDCYAGLDVDELAGEPACIDKVEDGYCTHECETDEDCCAVEGECETGFKQVCAAFENTGVKYCFLSCEDGDIIEATGHGGAGVVEADEFCADEANERFICRSTGGGNENRRACLPDGGAAGAGNMGGAGGEGGAMGGAGGAMGGMGGEGGAMGGAGGAMAGAGGA